MSTETSVAGIPQWDVADRMRKSLRDKEIGVQEIADELGVGRNTVSNWINGHTTPSGPVLRLWALRCGVPLEWLRDGVATSVGGPTPGGSLSNPRYGGVRRALSSVKARSNHSPLVSSCSRVPVAA